ncbi:MAG: hypothetical protein Q4C30_09430, partial [Bacteroidia bacterium]|nr:hypothetical protein [Bacteroidia bacterium]
EDNIIVESQVFKTRDSLIICLPSIDIVETMGVEVDEYLCEWINANDFLNGWKAYEVSEKEYFPISREEYLSERGKSSYKYFYIGKCRIYDNILSHVIIEHITNDYEQCGHVYEKFDIYRIYSINCVNDRITSIVLIGEKYYSSPLIDEHIRYTRKNNSYGLYELVYRVIDSDNTGVCEDHLEEYTNISYRVDENGFVVDPLMYDDL